MLLPLLFMQCHFKGSAIPFRNVSRRLRSQRSLRNNLAYNKMISRGLSTTNTLYECKLGEKTGAKFHAMDLMHKKVRWGRICISAPRRSEFKCKPPFPLQGHWTGHPDCKSQSCESIYPTFDSLYYKTSDKGKRCYQQTWAECPKLVVEERPICCYESYESEPMKKRTLEEIKKITRAGEGKPDKKIDPKDPCPKVPMPGCLKRARADPNCTVQKLPADCTKSLCPYPSFSECTRPKLKQKPRGECACWKFDGMCEVWAELRKQRIGGSKLGAQCK